MQAKTSVMLVVTPKTGVSGKFRVTSKIICTF